MNLRYPFLRRPAPVDRLTRDEALKYAVSDEHIHVDHFNVMSGGSLIVFAPYL